jgi:hypothetical protein
MRGRNGQAVKSLVSKRWFSGFETHQILENVDAYYIPAILNFTVRNRQKLKIFQKKFIFALSSQNGTKKTYKHIDLKYDP